jgi:benzoyl-CoA reductase subunit D
LTVADFMSRVPHTTVGEPLRTCGLDVGARSLKIAILSHEGQRSVVLAKTLVGIRGHRDIGVDRAAIREGWSRTLADAGLSGGDIDFVASTGTRDRQTVRIGHFYQRFSHALGARLLFPDAIASLDIGANQIRCALLSDAADRRRYAETSPETTDGAQTLETLARPAGMTSDEVGSRAMVARREDLATRSIKLLRSLSVDGTVVLTGGMVLDADFVCSLWRRLRESESHVSLLISPEAIFAGAYGAAILAARRFRRVVPSADGVAADPLARRIPRKDRRTLN